MIFFLLVSLKFSQFFKSFFPYLKSNVLKLVVVSITMILATALETSLPELTGKIIDNLFKEGGENNAKFYSLLIFGIIVVSALFTFISVNLSSYISNSVIMQLRVEMFAKLLKLPKKYFDTHDSGKILSKLTFDVEQISSVASTLWLELIKSLITVLVLVIYLFWTSWQLSISLVIILPLIFLAVKSSSLRIKNASKLVQDSMGDTTNHLSESINANLMVKIYQMFESSTKKFNNLANTIRTKRFRVDNISALNAFVVNVLIAFALALVVYFAPKLEMSAGNFIAFFTAMGMLIKPTKTLVAINKPLQKALAAGESVFGFMGEKEEYLGTKHHTIEGKIEFKNVAFAYGPNMSVLKNINFIVNSGQSLALVGATGSGKSTIAALIAGLYHKTSGEILIDGVDIERISIDILRNNIALVEQRINLFTGTIAENIATNKTLTKAELCYALNVASAEQFVAQLAGGIQSRIGNNGVELSGGQAQRLSIARAVAKDAPILILDEATSALDGNTEREVQAALDKLQIGRTTIIIAHRLTTIQNANTIAVVKAGKICEMGSHEELLSLNGEYCQLYTQYKDGSNS